MTKEYCVYVHTNKSNGKKYVGITNRKPEDRWKRGSAYKANPHFYNSIKKYGWDGFEHNVVMTGLSREHAHAWEKALIGMYESTDPQKGYNIALGGEGHDSFSKCTRIKMSKSAKRRFEDPDEIRKNRERGLRQFASAEAIEKDRQAQLKFHEENPEARYRRAKAVNQYDLDGNYIRTWKSARDASKIGICETAITSCCRHRYGRKSAGGFVWRFASEVAASNSIEPVQHDWHEKMVDQYTLDNVFVKRWDSISKAQKALNIKNISEVCNGRRSKAGGYIWCFAQEALHELQNKAI